MSVASRWHPRVQPEVRLSVEPFSVLILAGGRSQRLGRDKTQVRLGGRRCCRPQSTAYRRPMT